MRNLLLTILAISLYTLSSAEIIRVNNNVGISADFANLQQAIDSAGPGDTLYIEPSSTGYGNVNVNKRLSIYGPGYFLAENTGLQANLNTSKINILTFQPGSAFSSISGIEITQTLVIQTGNLAITRCYFSWTSTNLSFDGTAPNTNVLIAQCYFASNINTGGGIQTYTVFWRNNFFGGSTIWLDGPSIVNDFTNNVFNGTSYIIYSSSFVNNIFTNSGNFNLGNPAFNNGFEHNLFRNTQSVADTALGNLTGVNTTLLFTGGTTDGRFQIVPGSLADGTGKEIPSGTPTDIGMYGGPNPYKLSGVPAIPTIYDLVVPTSNTTGGLNVTIKAKSQD